MTTVLFQSRYRILDTTGFYYQSARTHDAFLVILSSVTFSTVGEENEMALKCVDIPEADAPLVDYETGIVTPRIGTTAAVQDYTNNPTADQKAAAAAWMIVTLNVGVYPYDSASLRWMDFARNMVENACPDDWPGGMPTIARALTDLQGWNSALWATSRLTDSNGDYSPECALASAHGFASKVPWLYTNDVVSLRLPYKQSYDDTYKQASKALN
jgi:hypothetical protein